MQRNKARSSMGREKSLIDDFVWTGLKLLAGSTLPPEEILRPFWDAAGRGRDLASNSKVQRHQAEDRLMQALHKTQNGSSSHKDGNAARHPHLGYALERLVKGLSSARDCAGEGFCAALQRMLDEFEAPLFPPEEVLALMDKHLDFTPSTLQRTELAEQSRGHFNGILALAAGLKPEAQTGVSSSMPTTHDSCVVSMKWALERKPCAVYLYEI